MTWGDLSQSGEYPHIWLVANRQCNGRIANLADDGRRGSDATVLVTPFMRRSSPPCAQCNRRLMVQETESRARYRIASNDFLGWTSGSTMYGLWGRGTEPVTCQASAAAPPPLLLRLLSDQGHGHTM